MDLSGAGGYFGINNNAWRCLLELAYRYGGWKPLGTEPFDGLLAEDKQAWDPYNYVTNDYQTVTAEDARNLADALERALPDVPGFRAREGAWRRVVSPGRGPNCLEFWSGPEARERLLEFIAFARAGGFVIY
jgi:hypothetical protein